MSSRNARAGWPLSRAVLVAVEAVLLTLLFTSFGAQADEPKPKMQAEQSPATSAVDADRAKAQQQQQIIQPLNNQPVWSEIRSSTPQTTTVVGRETNILIQPEGQTWRTMRNSMVSVYAGWALMILVLVIAAFYFWKGTMQLHEPPTGRRIRRFTAWQMAIHWTTAWTFVALAITGLIMTFGKNILLPLIGYTLFSWLTIFGKNLHNFIGPLFLICIVLLFFTFVRDNFWRRYDWNWIRHFGGLVSKHDVPSGKFNAGEKAWFWGGLLVAGLIVSASGLILDFPNFNQTRSTMQITNLVHLTIAALFMLAALGHIYMGTLGMAGAYNAMSTGYVDETWAKEHHLYWYNDIRAGKIPTAPDDVPAPAPRPA
jgi:formate dehydrogenase subunit gamma